MGLLHCCWRDWRVGSEVLSLAGEGLTLWIGVAVVDGGGSGTELTTRWALVERSLM